MIKDTQAEIKPKYHEVDGLYIKDYREVQNLDLSGLKSGQHVLINIPFELKEKTVLKKGGE